MLLRSLTVWVCFFLILYNLTQSSFSSSLLKAFIRIPYTAVVHFVTAQDEECFLNELATALTITTSLQYIPQFTSILISADCNPSAVAFT